MEKRRRSAASPNGVGVWPQLFLDNPVEHDATSELRSRFNDEPQEVIDILAHNRNEIAQLTRIIESLQEALIKASYDRIRLQRLVDAADANNLSVGCVYIVKSPYGYKIGKTKALHNRIRQLQTGAPYRIEHIFSILVEDMAQTERELHQQFEYLRLEGEWFKLDERDLDSIRNQYAGFILDIAE